MTELRLAGAVTIEEANALLKEFLDRFNARFGVPRQHPEAAYRPLGPGVCLDTALCVRHSRRVARDNTVKYRWRRFSCCRGRIGAAMRGRWQMCWKAWTASWLCVTGGEIIPSREAPPTPRHTQKLQRLFFTRDTPMSRSQRSEQALGGGPGSTRRTDGRRRC